LQIWGVVVGVVRKYSHSSARGGKWDEQSFN
jgi:hypothetical protein